MKLKYLNFSWDTSSSNYGNLIKHFGQESIDAFNLSNYTKSFPIPQVSVSVAIGDETREYTYILNKSKDETG
jgi:hypothetical protein